jgi:dihydropteroate synthase
LKLKSNPHLILIRDAEEAKLQIAKVGSTPEGVKLMWPKALHLVVKLENIKSPAANILKQEMLSLGGDVAASKDTINVASPRSDVLIMGTIHQFKSLIKKLRIQPFGLKEVAEELLTTIKNYENYSLSRLSLRCRNKTLQIGKSTLIMGVLNVTPDSFSDGGLFMSPEKALEHARELVEAGADIIDVGGESTRPGSEAVVVDEELNRTIPVIEKLKAEFESEVVISIDTYKSEVAKAALESGAHMVNDISGLNADPYMAEVISHYQAAVVLMHIKGSPKNMQLNPQYESLLSEIISYLRKSIEVAEKSGIGSDQIIIDPGIGFGKTAEHSLEILRNLRSFKSLGKPILVGTSRKSFIGHILNLPVNDRVEGTAATVAISIANGADIVRVHDIKQIKRVAQMTDAIVKCGVRSAKCEV